MNVLAAAAIDKKTDDGMPQSGKVTAYVLSGINAFPATVWWAAGSGAGASDTSATAGTSTTCYDNGGNAGIQHYSVSQNNGSGLNCALSFQFQ